jgi:hypothetical protein
MRPFEVVVISVPDVKEDSAVAVTYGRDSEPQAGMRCF